MDLLFSFTGRIGRGQFWLGYLAIIILMFIFGGIVSYLEPSAQATVTGAGGQQADVLPNQATVPQMIVAFVYLVFSAWISIAVCVKRFHDRGKSGWWYLIVLIPIIGAIWLLIELGCLRGDPGPNKYGPPVVPA